MRKKLYKAGKLWVIGIAASVGVIMLSPSSISADVSVTETPQATDTTVDNATELNSSNTETDSSKVETGDSNSVTETPQTTDTTVDNATELNSSNTETDSSKVETGDSNSVTETPQTTDTTVDNATELNSSNTETDSSKVETGDSNSVTETPQTTDTTVDNATELNSSNTETDSSKVETGDSNSVTETPQTTDTTVDNATELNSKKTVITKNTDGTSTTNITYANLKDVADNISNLNPKTSVPYFRADAIKNVPAMTTEDAQTGEIQDLDVWDSWALQDAKNGSVANYHGYNIVFALAGYPKDENDQHIYMLYTKYGDVALNDWKNAGPVFGFNAKRNEQQWSGSATVNDDDSIQLFYTKTDQPNTVQRLATANLSMSYNDSQVKVDKINSDYVIFAGDGENYQTIEQWKEAGSYTTGDNFTMRDPHVIEVNGERYLAFEANTGTNNYQSDDAVNNDIYYGGTEEFNKQAKIDTLQNPDKLKLSKKANGAIGLLKLTQDQNNPKVDQIYAPLLAANGVTDELERANIVPLNGKYYLFTDTRLSKSVVPTADFNINVGMMGYVSDSLFGPYVPLNGSGSVVTGTQLPTSRTDTYSYYAVPVEGRDDLLLITSYMSNRNEQSGKGMNSTFAPSFLIQISADGMSTKVLDVILAQGAWTYDGKATSVEELVGDKITSDLTNVKIGWVDGKFYTNNELASGYIYDYTNMSYYLFKDGVRLSGVQPYANSYYYFDPVTYKRVDNEIHQDSDGNKYYFGNDGRVRQGKFAVNGVAYDFGNDFTYYERGFATGYLQDLTDNRWYWFEDGKKYTGFRHYMNAYYFFESGSRQENKWETAWGKKYYVGADGRAVQGLQVIDGQAYDFGVNGTYNLKKLASGYIYSPNYSAANGGYSWFENGKPYTGFRYYKGSYYWFDKGIRQSNSWHEAWGKKYYVGADGRAVQGLQVIDGQAYDFGVNGTYNLKKLASGYIYSPNYSAANGGYSWFENGKPYTGFRYYKGSYYWFDKGIRQSNSWHEAWGKKYYVGADGRAVQGIQVINGKTYNFGANDTYYLR